MKKELVLALLCIATVSTALTGCGKSRQQQLSDQYQKEYGMSKQEADEWAEIANELYEDEQEWYEQELEREKEEAAQEAAAEEAFKLYDVSAEIKNSLFTDEIVQINDSVIPNDGSLTVKDIVDILSAYGPVTVKDGNTEITEDSLVQPTGSSLGTYRFVDEFDQDICSASYVNESDQIASAYDCRIANIGDPGNYSKNVLNFFYPGNICAAQYGVSSDVQESEAYARRSADFVDLTFQNAEEVLKSKGATGVVLNDEKYEFTVHSKEPVFQMAGEDGYHRALTYNFGVDMSTAKVESMYISSWYNTADATEKYLKDVTLMTPELKDKLDGLAAEKLSDWISDKCDSFVETVGYFTTDGYSGMKTYAIVKTDRGTLETVEFSIVQKFDGSYDISDYVSTGYGGPYDSVDAVLADYEVGQDVYVEAN